VVKTHQTTWGHRAYPADGNQTGPKVEATITISYPPDASPSDLIAAVSAAYRDALIDINRGDQ
jgi:hypothetical protein